MNLIVLDTNLRVVAIADTYNSMIWTDRFQKAGDFELCRPMERSVLDYLKHDYYLWRKDSEHVMIIEKVLIESDSEDGDRLIVSGRSLESILDRRVVWGLKTLSGNFQEAVKSLLDESIINPSKPERKISNFIFEASTDPAITALTIDTQYTGDNLYEVISALCIERNIGFKVTLNAGNQFVFKLYAGADRSYGQFDNPYVIFSPKFDNIIDSNYVDEKSVLKNVTLVGGEGEGSERRYTAVGNISGMDRRELFTDARDISSEIDEDITESFAFTQYPSQAFNDTTKTFVTDANFNSCMVDVSAVAGRTISITIPRYVQANDNSAPYATILVNASKQYVSTLKKWDKYEYSGELTSARGSLDTYEIKLPVDAQYIYTTMYSQAAIDADIYYGDADDFECRMIKLSNAEYISLLRQRGSEDLAENRQNVLFDGQADVTTMFHYGVDFFAGDIVQIADAYGHEAKARVTEVITSENEDGSATTYPTFEKIEEETIWLPGGYTELEYIGTNGTQYVDTGYKPNQNTRVIADMELSVSNVSSKCLMGMRNAKTAAATLAYSIWMLDGGVTIRSDYFGSSVSKSLDFRGQRVEVDKNKNNCYIEDELIKNASGTGQATLNLYLFTINNAGEVNTSYHSHAKLYSFKIYENETLVRNFIPCINQEGDIGLYDTVGAAFYGNLGTGTFIAGQKGV